MYRLSTFGGIAGRSSHRPLYHSKLASTHHLKPSEQPHPEKSPSISAFPCKLHPKLARRGKNAPRAR
ncbi:putative ankyrin repeat protein [Fusarium oxysporum f. sp. albedinis]|nr:putative ankyrin repeat protein [Fusarium oxysporum f. sp. albedinis]